MSFILFASSFSLESLRQHGKRQHCSQKTLVPILTSPFIVSINFSGHSSLSMDCVLVRALQRNRTNKICLYMCVYTHIYYGEELTGVI